MYIIYIFFFSYRYTVLFKNPRDNLSVQILAKQSYPSKPQAFLEAYEKLTRLPFSYMVNTNVSVTLLDPFIFFVVYMTLFQKLCLCYVNSFLMPLR